MLPVAFAFFCLNLSGSAAVLRFSCLNGIGMSLRKKVLRAFFDGQAGLWAPGAWTRQPSRTDCALVCFILLLTS